MSAEKLWELRKLRTGVLLLYITVPLVVKGNCDEHPPGVIEKGETIKAQKKKNKLQAKGISKLCCTQLIEVVGFIS